jgi:hypothetical protein
VKTDGLCLLEHTPDQGLSPDRMICTTVRQAVAKAAELTALGPAEIRPDQLPREIIAIAAAHDDGSVPNALDHGLYAAGPSDHVHAQVLAWAAALDADGQ